MITNYFSIVRKSVEDMVPKIIMNYVVNHVKEKIQSTMLEINKREKVNELMKESDKVTEDRKNAEKMLKVVEDIREYF